MRCLCRFVYLAAHFKNFDVPDILPFSARHVPDSTVPMVMVVPTHKSLHPTPGVFEQFNSAGRIVQPVLDDAEQSLRVGVIVADMRAAAGSGNTQVLQLGSQCEGFLRRPVMTP